MLLCDENTDVYVLDLDTKSLEKVNDKKIESGVKSACFRNDNRFLAIATNEKVYTFSKEVKDQEGSFDMINISGVSWNSQGNWLAVSGGKKLQFLEKNCHERQNMEFEKEIIAVSWSSHKDIIAVMLENYSVIILSSKNHVFHRKYLIEAEEELVPQIFWYNSSLSLAVVGISGTAYEFDFNFTVDSNEEGVFRY